MFQREKGKNLRLSPPNSGLIGFKKREGEKDTIDPRYQQQEVRDHEWSSGQDAIGGWTMMDQRLSGSLGRFLQRRAIQRLKNPPPSNQHPPRSWYWKVRFKFALGKRSLVMRGGIFGLKIYWGALFPVWNNVSIDEKRWGGNFLSYLLHRSRRFVPML